MADTKGPSAAAFHPAPEVVKGKPKNVYRECLNQGTERGNYFKVFRPLYKVLKKLDVLFIHDLLNLGAMNKRRDKKNRFRCTTEYLRVMGWTVKEQKARFKSLTDLKYIKVDMKRTKTGWCRWVRINTKKLFGAVIPEQQQEGGSGPNGTNPNGAKNKTSYGSQRSPNNCRAGGAATPPAARDGGSGDFKPLNGKQRNPEKTTTGDSPKERSGESPASRRAATPPPTNGTGASRINPAQTPPKETQPTPPQPNGQSPGTDGAATPHPYRQGNPRKEESMALAQFFVANEQSPKTRKVQPAEQDFGYAEALHGALVKKGMGLRPWSRIKWATYIARARRVHGDGRFTAVFPWYLKHVGDKFIPQAWCGRSVYEEFDKIEAAMKRDLERNPDVQITAEGREAAERLIRRYRTWPAGFAEKMPAVVEASAASLSGFAEKVREWKESQHDPDALLVRFCDTAQQFLFKHPYGTAFDWLKEKHSWVVSDGFRGNPSHLILKPEDPRFANYVRTKLGVRRAELWSDLVKEVNNVE